MLHTSLTRQSLFRVTQGHGSGFRHEPCLQLHKNNLLDFDASFTLGRILPYNKGMADLHTIKVRLGVVLFWEEKLILVRQNGNPFWVLPGGTLEVGEGLEEGAIREIKEELNLDINIQKLLYLADFIRPTTEGFKQTLDLFFWGAVIGGQLEMTLEENLDEVGLFLPDALSAMIENIKPTGLANRLVSDWQTGFTQADGLYLGKGGP